METNSQTYQLLMQISENDETAFQTFYNKYYDLVYRYVNNHISNEECVDEIVSDVFIKFWERRAYIKDIANIDYYIIKATKNHVINFWKKSSREKDLFQPLIDKMGSIEHISPERLFMIEEMHMEMVTAVETLPPRCKRVFKLVREDNKSYKEAAKEMKVSVKNIEVQLSIATKKLAKVLKRHLRKHGFTKVKAA